MKWEGCTVVVRDGAAQLICEDDDVDLQVMLPGESDDASADGAISILYWDEEGAVAFSGSVQPDGSFSLTCRSRPRTADLAWSGDRTRLEGAWQQADECGTWRVELASVEN